MYRKILVPLDGSNMSECVLGHVEKLARSSPEAEVILYRVCEPPVILADYPSHLQTNWEDHVRQETDHIQTQCRLYLDDTEKRLKEAGIKVTTQAGLGNAAEEILSFAAKNQVDLIVMSTHGRSGITRWAFGSTSNKVLQSSKIPVLVIRPEECKSENQE